MRSLFKSQLMQVLIISSIGCLGLYVFATAPRKVTIPVSTGTGLELHNGSSVSVNYNVTCYNKAGTQLFQKTGQSLVAHQSTNYGGPPKCADGSVGQIGMGTNSDYKNGMVKCGSVPFSNFISSSNYCGTNFSTCTYTQFQANRPTYVPYDDYGWFSYTGTGFSSANTNSGSWSYRYGSSSSWYTNYYNEIPYGHYSSNSGYYACNTASDGSGTTLSDCGVTYMGSTNPVYCCPGTGAEVPSNSCVVEIESTTAGDGYLQSPQFKGNSAF